MGFDSREACHYFSLKSKRGGQRANRRQSLLATDPFITLSDVGVGIGVGVGVCFGVGIGVCFGGGDCW